MVQHKPAWGEYKPLYSDSGQPIRNITPRVYDGSRYSEIKHYWMLKNWSQEGMNLLYDAIKQKNFHYDSSTSCRRLLYLLSRADRDLIFYDQYDIRALEQFALDRKICLDYIGPDDKRVLIERLEYEDENGITFGKYLDLPPELRGLVNTFYFESIHKHDTIVAAPPLAEVCRRLRKEVLPQFYAERCFNMELTDNTYPKMWILDDPEERFFTRAPKEHVALVKKLGVGIWFDGDAKYRRWIIDLPTLTKPGIWEKGETDEFSEGSGEDERPRLEAEIETKLLKAFKVIKSEMGSKSFEKGEGGAAGKLVNFLLAGGRVRKKKKNSSKAIAKLET